MRQNHETVKRSRGRPQKRCDADTLHLIVAAADHEFQSKGYAGTSIMTVAQRAGVSTKTLYKLVATKAELFERTIQDRIGRFLLDVVDDVSDDLDPRAALEHILFAFGVLTLSPETIAITRLVISECERFPEVARAFYQSAIVPVNGIIEAWLTTQKDKGLLRFDDVHITSGLLRGMMIMEPQRTAMMAQRGAPHRDEIALRARQCADVFYNGCKA